MLISRKQSCFFSSRLNINLHAVPKGFNTGWSAIGLVDILALIFLTRKAKNTPFFNRKVKLSELLLLWNMCAIIRGISDVLYNEEGTRDDRQQSEKRNKEPES